MDYYQKYLKYKNKYLILRRRLYGGDLTEEQKIRCFDYERFKEVGAGLESVVYLDTQKNLVYKVIKKRKPKNLGVWGKITQPINEIQHTFDDSVQKYIIASDNDIGPKFYGSYSTDKHNIIVMEYIEGYTLEKIYEMSDRERIDNNIPHICELIKKKSDTIPELITILYPDFIPSEEIKYPPIADFHDGNFIYRPRDGKLFAIDL